MSAVAANSEPPAGSPAPLGKGQREYLIRRAPNCACGAPKRKTEARCDECFGLRFREKGLSPITRFHDDADAMRFVDENPGGASLGEIARAFGLTRERVRQIESVALPKLRERLQRAGISREDLQEWLAGIAEGRRLPEREPDRVLAQRRRSTLTLVPLAPKEIDVSPTIAVCIALLEDSEARGRRAAIVAGVIRARAHELDVAESIAVAMGGTP